MTGVAYLAVEATTGILTEVRAVDTSSGAGDATKIPALDASGKLVAGFMPSGFGTDTVTVTASEALSAGDFVNLWSSTGIKARKADNTTAGKQAHGYVIAGVSNGASATVYMSGENTAVTGLTVGARQFLSATGGHTETAPTTAGQVLQVLGVATSTTSISFAPATPVTRA
jgi:hypothetical protein